MPTATPTINALAATATPVTRSPCSVCGPTTWYCRLTKTRFLSSSGRRRSAAAHVTRMSSTDIESPFASPGMADMGEDEDKDALLPLTLENVETVLDEMRPYLMSDG